MTPEQPSPEQRLTRIEISAVQPRQHVNGGIRIEWGTTDVEFGELVIYATGDKPTNAHSSNLCRVVVGALLAELGRRVKLTE